MYATSAKFLGKFVDKHLIFKYGFNLSPMYRRSTGKVFYVSKDLATIKVKIPLSIKNRNYVGSLFGGSMSSATDPIYMIQLINILGDDYVVWDKEATIRFKRPARETAYATFHFAEEEIEQIKRDVADKNEIDVVKELNITNKDKTLIFAKLTKTVYVANKSFFKEKRKNKKQIKNRSK